MNKSAAFDAGARASLEKRAVDPATIAGLLAAGKIMGANAVSRHAHKIRPLRWLGKEIAGVGARTAAQGKPQLSRLTREALAIGVDPKVVGLYEGAYEGVKGVGANNKALRDLKLVIQSRRAEELSKRLPAIAQTREFLSKVPTESTGVRKGVDYLFSDVRDVGRDIRNLVRRRNKTAAAAASPAAGLAALTKARQRTPAASVVAARKAMKSGNKPGAPKPSRELGLGEQTMTMSEVKSPATKLQQPKKPPRY